MRFRVKFDATRDGFFVSGMGFSFTLTKRAKEDGATVLECDAVKRQGADQVIYLGITVNGFSQLSADLLETLVARELVEHWDFGVIEP